ncbi:MAG: AAA family ATPase [Clostridiaceae bacterium]|nr:AAA family ATPase [Clostridiaceae bacterium]
MYLVNLKLWNFRAFGGNNEVVDDTGKLRDPDLDVDFSNGLNVLIGENDSGKTAIIDAIKLITNTHSTEWIRLTSEDFHKDRNNLRIECSFIGLKDIEAKNFTEWLCMDGDGDDSKPYLKVVCEAKCSQDRVSFYDIRAGADNDGQLLSAEAREYLKAIFLKPLRDAESELAPKRNSRLSQVLSGHDFFKSQDNSHVLTDLSSCFNCLAHKYFHADYKRDDCKHEECPIISHFDLDSDGESIRDSIDKAVQSFSGNDSHSVKFGFGQTNPKIKQILEPLRLSLTDEQLGLGSHNLLFIATELLNLERDEWSGIRLGLIEEIEAHLHPQSQMRIIEYLCNFIRQEEIEPDKKEDIQLIVTTHSPNIGSKVPLDSLIICKDGHAFPMGTDILGQSYTKLEKTDHSFLERFLDTTKANLFFAKGVILVEGWAEEIMLPSLAKKIGVDLTKKGISIVNVGSTALLRYSKIFLRKTGAKMDLPVAVITDLDIKPNKHKEADPETKTESDFNLMEEINSKKTKYEGDTVKAYISPHWTLEYCIALSPKLAPHLYMPISVNLTGHFGFNLTDLSERKRRWTL